MEVLYFRRYGYTDPKFVDLKPKWHITTHMDIKSVHSASAVGLCGYTYDTLLDVVMVRARITNRKIICNTCARRKAQLEKLLEKEE